MPDLTVPPVPAVIPVGTTPTTERPVRTVARWLVTFTGFPLGGLAAHVVVGPVDGPGRALAGGLLAGAILGAVQAWGLGPARPRPARWIVATAIGLAAGLTAGAAAVGYGVGLADLTTMGAVCGLAVGAAQSLVLRDRLGRWSAAWPPALAAAWALGWAITTAAGVVVDERFTTFGSSGAVTVALLTTVLPLALTHTTRSPS